MHCTQNLVTALFGVTLGSRPLAFLLLGSLIPTAASADGPLISASTQAFVRDYCIDCHNPEKKKGKLDLQSKLSDPLSEHAETWRDVALVLENREMPPEDEPDLPRPSEEHYRQIAEGLHSSLAGQEASLAPQAGNIKELVGNYCTGCHNAEERKGDLDLARIRSHSLEDHTEIWEKVVTRLQARQMPPPERKRPSEEGYQTFVSLLETELDRLASETPTPGRTGTFRRLTRTEYENAIRDLLAVNIDAASLLPQDEESHGFDNVTVGSLSPSLVDRYITAAQKISRLAVGQRLDKPLGDTFRIPPDYTQEKHVAGLPLGTRGGTLLPYTFPQDGEYEIEVILSRDRNEHVEGLRGSHEMDILIDRALIERFTVSRKGHQSHAEVDKHLKIRTYVKSGPRKVGVTFHKQSYSLLENKRQPFEASFNLHRHPRRSPAVYQISISGPFAAEGASDTPSRDRIFIKRPRHPHEEKPVAKEILSHLARRAFRRPTTPDDTTKLMAFYTRGAQEGSFEAGIESALRAILVSPDFLFRIEKELQHTRPGSVYAINDLELASRLSFFIWSSIPDEELLSLAEQGQLRDPSILQAQVRRMLSDERSLNLVNNFASQWLHLRNLEAITPDLRLFPDFDDNLRQAFREETKHFLESILREDRSVMDLLHADYTFLNERLAHHYDIPGVFGSRFRRVDLSPDHHRGGLLRQGSILTVTSYATRTSPVIRGNWILDNILGTPPPPPPPNVPTLEDNKVDATLSMRERLAEHRANPACASCHNLMDPVGFALENFDAVGRWRQYENGREIDVSGGLPDGRVLAGVDQLEKGLLERPELFVRTLTQKLLTFALGRGVEPFDAPAIRKIIREAKEDNFRLSSLVLGITQSVPFQLRTKVSHEQLAAQ